MKPCSPPRSATTSGPGLSMRWYVLARTTSTPTRSRSSLVRVRTVARVPTGMKHGVANVPLAVVTVVARALPSRASTVWRRAATGSPYRSAVDEHGVAEGQEPVALGQRDVVQRTPPGTDE